MEIHTDRLQLVPCSAEHLLALIDGTGPFEESFGLPVAEGLHGYLASDDVSPAWLQQLRASSGTNPWVLGFAVVHRDEQVVIGMASFKGPPDAEGTVEIAYGIAPGFEGQGFATEAAQALVTFASGDDRVRQILAHTLPEENASTRVLSKCGFECTGEIEDPEDGLIWRWARDPGQPASAY